MFALSVSRHKAERRPEVPNCVTDVPRFKYISHKWNSFPAINTKQRGKLVKILRGKTTARDTITPMGVTGGGMPPTESLKNNFYVHVISCGKNSPLLSLPSINEKLRSFLVKSRLFSNSSIFDINARKIKWWRGPDNILCTIVNNFLVIP